MKIRLLDLARDDLIEGFRFYEEKEPGLGRYFLLNLYADIESLRITSGTHSKPHREFYRALSKRFPFAIYYSADSEIIAIRAVVDCRRSPSWIRKHLRKA